MNLHGFEKRVTGGCRAPEAWIILRVVFLKRPDAELEAFEDFGLLR